MVKPLKNPKSGSEMEIIYRGTVRICHLVADSGTTIYMPHMWVLNWCSTYMFKKESLTIPPASIYININVYIYQQ
jgi:hypothetical protein